MIADIELVETLARYASSWGPLTSDSRIAVLQTCLREDFIYTDPNIRTVGYEELAVYMEGFQQQLPGGGFSNRDVTHHHDALLVQWDMTDVSGAVLSPGASFGVIGCDGRLASMTGFFAQ